MPTCPICNTHTVLPICPECGFDRTRDYERFPTFGPLGAGIDARSRRQRERGDLMRCSKCGCAELHFRFADRNFSCPRCGHLFTPRETDTLLAIMGCAPLHHQGKPAAAPAAEKRRITAVSAGYAHTVVLYSDGTVRAIGLNRSGQCDTGHWRGITAIAAGYDTTVGLKEDGTIVSTRHIGSQDLSCTNVTSIASGAAGIVCVRRDGTVAFPWSDISARDWYGIRSAAASWSMVLGVKTDGTVAVFSGEEELPARVRNWLNLRSIAVGFGHVAGLRHTGIVVSDGDNTFEQCRTDSWKDITAIAAGDNHTVGLRADGTVVAAGVHGDGRCNVRHWRNVTAVTAGGSHTVALCADGTLLAAGSNREGQCAVSRLIPR